MRTRTTALEYSKHHPTEIIEIKEKYSDGSTYFTGFALNGQREGLFEYYRGGIIVKREIYNSTTSQIEHTELRPDGNIRRQYFSRRHCTHGEAIWFDEDGTVTEHCFYNSDTYVNELSYLVNEPRDDVFYFTLALHGIDKEYTFKLGLV